MKSLIVKIVEKEFSNDNGNGPDKILSDISFMVNAGSIICLFGPSGCGKTTLIRIIAGVDQDFVGDVFLDDQRIAKPSRRIGMTVQTGFAYNWLSVADNIGFGLRYNLGRNNKYRFEGEIKDRIKELAQIVGLSLKDLDKYPEEISGGMRQRMAFARAIATNPEVVLLDEPFSSIDTQSRELLQDVVLKVRENFGTTFLFVSHDPEEAIYTADKILVLGGRPATINEEIKSSFNLPGSKSVDNASDIRYSSKFQQEKRHLRRMLGNIVSKSK